MINILCHRGLWKYKKNHNNLISLEKAVKNSFGIELDIRDYENKIIISHDIFDNKKSHKLLFEYFLKRNFKEINKKKLAIAINIKSDGLFLKLKKILKIYKIKNYFCFDMSAPETFKYIKYNLNFYSRFSKFENNILFKKESKGIWIDCFDGNFLYKKSFNKKILCYVSPELHNKNNKRLSFWKKLKNLNKKKNKTKIFLCTDFPIQANLYFND